ncbi:HNH endonuclease [Salegentibacter sp. HM20]
MKKGQRLWTRDELVLTINLYCKLPFGKLHKSNPQVIHLSNLLGRTPSSIAYKLVNFASLDPSLQARGIKGAANTSKLDNEIWNEFYNNWNDLPYQSEILRAKFEQIPVEFLNNIKLDDIPKSGFYREYTIKSRVNQAFFRQMVLASYDSKCCITGINIQDLLVAGHIRPWASDEKNRINPENGLLINSLHDKAFENGWISIDDKYKFQVSSKINQFLPNEMIEKNFLHFANKKISLPNKFLPNPEFLKEHYEQRFKK